MPNQTDTRIENSGILSRTLRWVVRHEMLLLALLSPFFLLAPQLGALGAALAFAIWLCRWRVSGRLTMRTPLDGLVALLVGIAALGLIPSVALQGSLAAFWRLLFGVLCFYGVVNALEDNQSLRRAAVIVLLGCLGLTLLCLVATDWSNVRLMALPIYRFIPRLMQGVWASEVFNPRTVALTLAMLLPLALAYTIAKGHRLHRALAALTALLMTVTLLLSQSPQGLLGLAAGLFTLAALWRWQVLLLLPVSAAAGVAWVAKTGMPRLAETLLSMDQYAGFGTALRLDIWSRALDMLRDMPYTGVGLDTFPHMIWHFYPGFALGKEPHSHNLYLQVALDLGLPGLLIFLGIVGFWLWWALKAHAVSADSQARTILAGCTAGVVAFLTCGLIDTVWASKPVVFIWVLLALGMVASKPLWAASKPARRRQSVSPQTLLAIGMLAAVAVSILVSPGLLTRNIGVLRAHHVLYQTESSLAPSTGALTPVRDQLQAIAHGPQANSHVHNLLGRSNAWLQEYSEAIAAFRQEVTFDSADPLAHYVPHESLRTRLLGAHPLNTADALLKVYSAWMTRYPERAEAYVRVAMVWAEWKGDKQRALTIVQRGIDAGAVPEGLLESYRAALE